MAERDGESSPFPAWPLLIALAAAIGGGVVFWPAPLKSSRPGGNAKIQTASVGDQTVQARLWQDPFEAIQPSVHEWLSNSPLNSHEDGVEKMDKQIERRLAKTNVNDIVIFQVMVPGGPYADNKETRLRSRYAVVSALQTAGYVPRDEDHLGWFEVPWNRGADFETNPLKVPSLHELEHPDQRLFIPYEWYRTDESHRHPSEFKHGAVLVLWLRDDAFGDHPLQRLAQLRGALHDPMSPRLDFRLVDPRLGAIFSDDPANLLPVSISCPGPATQSVPITNLLKSLGMFSSWSTTPDALVWQGATALRRESIARALAPLGIEFFNVTCTDNELAGSLIHELKLRGVDLTKENDGSAALIAERDTEYGRGLPLTFRAALNSARSNMNFNLSLANTITNNLPGNVYCFSYLRGIDGLLPGESTAKSETDKDASGNGKEKSKSELVAELERPEGQNQLDYVPRMAQVLKDFEREADTRHKPLRAIGVLGSDVYDKLLVLQSLHNRFPDVIFFTTDLDARLFHPSELKWTRNLVVASSFGLQLGEDLQKNIPPFRDTYQTGEYLACLAALGNELVLTNLQNIRPRMFEIGRRGAYALDVGSDKGPEDPFYRVRPASLDRQVPDLWAVEIASFCVLIAIFFTVFYIKPKGVAWVGFAVALILAVWATLHLYQTIQAEHRGQDGEPFSLLDGVSIWPCEIVRVLGIALAFTLLVKAWGKVSTNHKEMARDFMLTEGGPTSVEKLWSEHVKKGKFLRRAGRILLLTFLYFEFGYMAMKLAHSFMPFRGEISKQVDDVLRLAGGVLLLVLTFFVVDTALRSRRFAKAFAEGTPQWPSTLLVKYRPADGVAAPGVEEWLAVQFLAQGTAKIEQFIYYPFFVLLVMIAARFADGFNWPITYLLLLCLIALLVFGVSVSLHVAAAKARNEALDRLQEQLVQAQCCQRIAERKTIQLIMDKIKEIDGGAFAPLSKQPFIRAVLLPAGAAIAALVQSI